jgi:hypothetical protein
MPAILRRHVNFDSKAAGEALIRPGEMTSAEAAALAECSTENIRLWVRKHRIGIGNRDCKCSSSTARSSWRG